MDNEELRKEITEIRDRLLRIEYLLDNDSGTGQKGIVAEQRNLRERLENVETMIKYRKGVRAAFVLIGAAMVWIAEMLIKNWQSLFPHK